MGTLSPVEWLPHGGPIPRVRSDADASLPSIPVSVRALLTGGSGFVGTHLQAVLRDAGFSAEEIAALADNGIIVGETA